MATSRQIICCNVYRSPRAMHMDVLCMPAGRFMSAVQCQLADILLVAIYGCIHGHIDLYQVWHMLSRKDVY